MNKFLATGAAALLLGGAYAFSALMGATPVAARSTTNPCFLYEACASHVLCGWAVRGFALNPNELYFSGVNRRKLSEVRVTALPGVTIGEEGAHWNIDLFLSPTEMSRYNWRKIRVVDISYSFANHVLKETVHSCQAFPSSIG